MMHLLDTDTLTHAHLGNGNIADRIKQVGEENVATTIVTAIEILRGRHEFLLKAADGTQLLRAQQLLDGSEELLRDIQICPVDPSTASHFDGLRRLKKLKNIGRADLLIACIALSQEAILVTRNIKHFHQVPDLRVENWMQ